MSLFELIEYTLASQPHYDARAYIRTCLLVFQTSSAYPFLSLGFVRLVSLPVDPMSLRSIEEEPQYEYGMNWTPGSLGHNTIRGSRDQWVSTSDTQHSVLEQHNEASLRTCQGAYAWLAKVVDIGHAYHLGRVLYDKVSRG